MSAGVEIAFSSNAFADWLPELCPDIDGRRYLQAMDDLPAVPGHRIALEVRHPLDDPDEQRRELALAVDALLRELGVRPAARPFAVAFDQSWVRESRITRHRGARPLIARLGDSYGIASRVVDTASIRRAAEVRRGVQLELPEAELAGAIHAAEDRTAALWFSRRAPDCENALTTLFLDPPEPTHYDARLTLWAAQAAELGDIPVVCHELNDDTGRIAIALGAGSVVAPGSAEVF